MTVSLLQQIKTAALDARKARQVEKGTFLTTLYAEAAMEGKNDGNRESTDAEVTSVIRKFLKNNTDALAVVVRDGTRQDLRARLEFEQDLLKGFMPPQASEGDITTAVAAILDEMPGVTIKQVGVVMGKLVAKFGDNFDKTFASKLVKDRIMAQ